MDVNGLHNRHVVFHVSHIYCTQCGKIQYVLYIQLRGHLIETYKITTGKEKVRKEDSFILSDTGYNL